MVPCIFSCQFVIQDGGDYAVNIVDPDIIVDWELIEQVVSVKPTVLLT